MPKSLQRTNKSFCINCSRMLSFTALQCDFAEYFSAILSVKGVSLIGVFLWEGDVLSDEIFSPYAIYGYRDSGPAGARLPQEPDDGRHVADGRNGCWNLKWRHRVAAVVAFTPELNDTVSSAPPRTHVWSGLPAPGALRSCFYWRDWSCRSNSSLLLRRTRPRCGDSLLS